MGQERVDAALCRWKIYTLRERMKPAAGESAWGRKR